MEPVSLPAGLLLLLLWLLCSLLVFVVVPGSNAGGVLLELEGACLRNISFDKFLFFSFSFCYLLICNKVMTM